MSDLPRPTETPAFFGALETPAFFGAPETPLQYAEPTIAEERGYNLDYGGGGDKFYLDDLFDARDAGYSWPEINNDQSRRYAAAYEQGYTQPEIDDHLGYRDPQVFDTQSQVAWATVAATNPEMFSGLAKPEPSLDLSLSPSFRSDYADALLGGDVRSPLDFSLRYAASALEAADSTVPVADKDEETRRLLAGGFAAEEAAAGLPTQEELVDATLAVSKVNGGDPAAARETLLDRWQKTGMSLTQQAIEALADGAKASLYATAKPVNLHDSLVTLMADFGEGLYSSREALQEKLKDAGAVEQLATVLGRTVSPRAFWEMFAHNGEMVVAAAKGEPIDAVDAFFAAAAMAHISRHPGGGTWRPADGDILPPLPRVELPPRGPRPEGPIIEGDLVAGGALEGPKVKLPSLPDVPVIDFDAPGAPMRMITAREALIDPPKAPEIISQVGHELSLMSKADRMEALRAENEGAATADSTGTFFQRKLAEMQGAAGFTGEMRTFHAGDAPVMEWLPSRLVPDQIRYDGGGGVFGRHTYLAENQDWITGDGMGGELGRRVKHEVAANFENAFVLTPSTFGQLKQIVPDAVATGDGANLANALIEKGYDGLIIRGFDELDAPTVKARRQLEEEMDAGKVTDDEYNSRADKLLADSPYFKKLNEIGMNAEWAQNQVVAFSPEKQLQTRSAKPIRKLPEGAEEPTPQRLAEIAEGFDNARVIDSYFADTFKALMVDESGSLQLRRSPEDRAKFALARQQRLDTRTLVIEEQALGEQKEHYVEHALKPILKYLNAIEPEFKAEVAKGPAGAPMETEQGAFINFLQGVGYGPVLRLDHPITPAATVIRKLNEQKYAWLQEAFDAGLIEHPSYRDNYFRQMWKNPKAAADFYDGYVGGGRQGSAGTLKERKHPTWADGLAAGLEPVHTNIAQLIVHDIGSTVRMIHAASIRQRMEKELGVLAYRTKGEPGEVMLKGVGSSRSVPIQKPVAVRRAEAEARAKMEAAAAPFNARIAQLEADVQALVNRNASPGSISYARQLVADERNVRRATLEPFQEDVAALTEAAAPGSYQEFAYAPPAVAKLYNQWVGGDWMSPETHNLKTQLFYLKNRLVTATLLAPLFHAFTILGAVATSAAMEVSSNLYVGRRGEALKQAAVLPSAIKQWQEGTKAWNDYVNMVDNPILNDLVKGGMRVGKRQIAYSTGQEQAPWHSWVQNNAGATAQEKAKNLASAAGRDLMRRLNEVGGPPGEPLLPSMSPFTLGSAALALPRLLKIPLDEFARAAQVINAPLFDYFIPVMSAGAKIMHFGSWLNANPYASPAQVRRASQQANMDVEYRYGEQNMNNIFVANWLKSTAQMSMISATWALSSWAWTAGALRLRPGHEWNSFGTRSFVSSLVMYHMINGLLTLGHTGQLPQSYLDLVNFRTGTTLASGLPQRGQIPTELKEHYDMGKIAATAYARSDPMYAVEGMFEYWMGKGHAGVSILRAELTGEDAIGRRPGYMPGGRLEWYRQVVFPMVMENYLHPKANTGLNTLERLFMREAPEWVSNPEVFYGKQSGLASRWSKEGIRRAINDDKKLETPKYPDLVAPSTSRSRGPAAPKKPRSRSNTGVNSPGYGR